MVTRSVSSFLTGMMVVVSVSGCLASAGTGNSENKAPAESSDGNKGEGLSMRVLWTVTGYVRGKTATLTDEEARTLLFKPLDMDNSFITFNGKTCNGIKFEREQTSAEGYLTGRWYTTPQELNLSDMEITVIRTTCALPGFGEYMQLKDRRLIVPINGVFFFFDPAVSY